MKFQSSQVSSVESRFFWVGLFTIQFLGIVKKKFFKFISIDMWGLKFTKRDIREHLFENYGFGKKT